MKILNCVLHLFLVILVINESFCTSPNWQAKLAKNGFNGPVYTFVKTDEQANIKWGVRHYVPRKQSK